MATVKSASFRLACQMGVYCREHGHVHGAEAEQLRKGIENLIAYSDTLGSASLQRLLDEVDARDSLAFLEITEKHERADRAWAKERGLLPEKKRAAKPKRKPGAR